MQTSPDPAYRERTEPGAIENQERPITTDHWAAVAIGVALVDATGRLKYANQALAEMVGCSVDELTDPRPPVGLWPDGDYDSIRAAMARVAGDPASPQSWEIVVRRPDGSRLDASVSVRPLPTGDEPCWLATVIDATEHKRVRRERVFMTGANRVLAASLEADTALEGLAALIVRELADYCLIDIVGRDQGMRRIARRSPDGSAKQILKEVMKHWPARLTDPDGIGAAIRTRETILVADAATLGARALADDQEFSEFVRAAGIRSWIIAPLLARDDALGAITLLSAGSGRRYGEADRRLIQEIAERAGLSIHATRMYRAAQREVEERQRLFTAEREARAVAAAAAERMARLSSLAAALSEAATQKEVAAVVLDHGMPALGAIAAGVRLVDPSGARQTLISVRSPGLDASEIEWLRDIEVSARWPANDALRGREVIAFTSREECLRTYPNLEGLLSSAGYEAMVAVPLEIEGRAIGSMTYSFAERRTFPASDRAFVLAIARQAAQAIERARLLEAERDARRRAEHASVAKSQFLATMSHELRTPLNAVVGFADLLAEEIGGPLTAKQRVSVDRIRAGADHLISVIDDILSFSRIEANREKVRIKRTELAQLILDAVALLEKDAAQKNIDIRAVMDRPLPSIWTDGPKVRQILINLLNNAVKFTDRGTITVDASIVEGGVRIDVRDTGPGIPPHQLERVFEPFTQLDSSSTRVKGGAGLGLAVSRRLARLLGGEITLRSRPGMGSTFSVFFPYQVVAPASAEGDQAGVSRVGA